MYVQPIVFDIDADKERLSSLVAPLDRSLMVELLSRGAIDLYWNLTRITIPEAQEQFIATLGEDSLADDVRAMLAESNERIMVDPITLSTTIAFVLSRAEGNARPQSVLKLIGALSFETLREPGTSTMRYDGVASLFASANLASERYLNIVWRLHELIQFARSAEGRAHHAYVDLDAAFGQYLGMAYEDWIAALIMLEVLFNAPASEARGRPSLSLAALHTVDSAGLIRRVLSRLTASSDKVTAVIDREPFPSLRTAVANLFQSQPFVELESDRVAIAAPQALDNAAALGWLYAIADARRIEDPKLSQQLWIFFGAFFESYIAKIFGRVATATGGQMWCSLPVDWGDLDVAMVVGDALILCEVVSGRIAAKVFDDPTNDTLIDEQLSKVLYEKATQVGEHARLFCAGELILPGLDSQQIRTIYPLVVQYHSIPREEPMQQRIDQHLQAAITGCDQRVRSIEIIGSETIEGLEQYLRSGISIGDLIDEKLGDRSTAAMSFKNFLFHRHSELPLRLPDDVAEEVKAWQGLLFERAKSWAVPGRRPTGTGLE